MMQKVDAAIAWLEGETFKKACLLFIAFAAGYFLRSIL